MAAYAGLSKFFGKVGGAVKGIIANPVVSKVVGMAFPGVMPAVSLVAGVLDGGMKAVGAVAPVASKPSKALGVKLAPKASASPAAGIARGAVPLVERARALVSKLSPQYAETGAAIAGAYRKG